MSLHTDRPENECDAIIELIADYAFGLTSAEETRRVEAGLPHCAEARQMLDEYRQMQGIMRDSVREVAPPPTLRANLMAAIAAPPVKPAATAPTQPPAPAVMPPPQRTNTAPRLHPAWLATAAAVVLLVISNIFWLTQNTAAPENQPDAFAVSAIDSLRWVRMNAEPSHTGTVLVMWNEASATGMMYAAGLPELPEGRVYKLWLSRDGVRTGMGTFMVSDTGDAALLFNSGDAVGSFSWVWVTEESTAVDATPSDIVVADSAI